MSTRNNSNQLVNPMARQALDKFKMEAAQELNIRDEYKSGSVSYTHLTLPTKRIV